MNSNVLKAILAMDSYNRGYNAGIKFGTLSGNNSADSAGIKIGSAEIITNSGIYLENGNRLDEDIGFYSIAYKLSNGEKVIAYRGTDEIAGDGIIGGDLWNGYGVGAGSPEGKQAELAFKFYNTVAGVTVDPTKANIYLTGHSLGGGLAGLVVANDNYRSIKLKVA